MLRIGELSRRSGVSPDLLRAWERRYGLLRPARSEGGLRLYSLDDLERVRAMRRHLDAGLAAAEAAALAAGNEAPSDPGAALAAALDAFDEPAAQSAVDELLARLTVDAFLRDVVLPYLQDLGDRWHRGEATVAQEHFASGVLRGRLLGLARGWGRGVGPRALLACAPGEQHDLALIVFGVALRGRGWRVDFIGADTPVESLESAAAATEPALVVVSATVPERLVSVRPALRGLAARHRLALAGAGARDDGLDVLLLTDDPVTEAERMTRLVAG